MWALTINGWVTLLGLLRAVEIMIHKSKRCWLMFCRSDLTLMSLEMLPGEIEINSSSCSSRIEAVWCPVTSRINSSCKKKYLAEETGKLMLIDRHSMIMQRPLYCLSFVHYRRRTASNQVNIQVCCYIFILANDCLTLPAAVKWRSVLSKTYNITNSLPNVLVLFTW